MGRSAVKSECLLVWGWREEGRGLSWCRMVVLGDKNPFGNAAGALPLDHPRGVGNPQRGPLRRIAK
jgi:hypothetical protein